MVKSLIAAALILSSQGDPIEWKVATLPGGYAIDAPRPITRHATSTDPGSGIVTDLWTATDWGHVYVIGLSKFPPGSQQNLPAHQLLASVALGWLKEEKSVIRAQRDLILKGWPGIEVEFVSPIGTNARFRAYIIGDILFQAGVTHTGSKPSPE